MCGISGRAFFEGCAVHEGIHPLYGMAHAFRPKFVSHQEQQDVS